MSDEMKEDYDKLENKKVLPQKTHNLKDVEYDTEVVKKEICENLDE